MGRQNGCYCLVNPGSRQCEESIITSRYFSRRRLLTFGLRFLRFAFQGALERLIQGGLCAFVFLLADAALLVFYFEMEELFLQAFEEHGGGGAACSGWLRTGVAGTGGARGHRARGGFFGCVVFIVLQRGQRLFPGKVSAVGGLLPRGDVDSADDEDCRETAEDVPAIFLQRVGSVDGRSEAAARAALALRRGTAALAGLAAIFCLARPACPLPTV